MLQGFEHIEPLDAKAREFHEQHKQAINERKPKEVTLQLNHATDYWQHLADTEFNKTARSHRYDASPDAIYNLIGAMVIQAIRHKEKRQSNYDAIKNNEVIKYIFAETGLSWSYVARKITEPAFLQRVNKNVTNIRP